MSLVSNKEISITELVIWLKKLFKFLMSKLFIIVLSVIVTGAAGVVYAWLKKAEYVAEMTFATESSSSSSLGIYAGIASQFGVDLGATSPGIFEGESLIELLLSRTMIEKTLLSPIKPGSALLMVEEFLNNHDKDWRKNPKTKNIQFQLYPQQSNRVRDSIIQKVFKEVTKEELNINRDKKTNFITISMQDNNEIFAERFVESLVNNAIKFYSDYKSKKAAYNLEVIQNQTDSVRRMLFGNISEVASINDLNVNPLRQIGRTGAQRKQVDVQANAALYGEMLKNLELSRMALRKETPLIQIIDVPVLPLEKIKPGRLLTGLIFAFVGLFIITVFFTIRFITSYSNIP